MSEKNILLQALFSVIIVYSVFIKAYTSECTPKDDYSGIAGECDKFLRCSNGVFFVFTCAPGTLYDYKRKLCDYPQNVACLQGNQSTVQTTTSTAKSTVVKTSTINSCSQETEGYLSGVPGDCTKYYKCVSGILVMLTCEAGTQFDYILKRCVWFEEAVCLPDTTTAKMASSTSTSTSTTTPMTTSFKNGCTQADDYTGVIGDCSKFLRCANGIIYEFTCAPGTLFDHIRKLCDYPDKVTCLANQNQLSTKKPCIKVCNEKESELTSVQGNCKAYLRCISGSLVEFICEPGYNFDVVKKKCIVEKDALCANAAAFSKTKKACTEADEYTGVIGDCSKFLRCASGIFYEFTCAPGTLFDYIRKMCDYPQSVTCLKDDSLTSTKNTPLTTLKTCTDSDDFSGVPGDCKKYYRCISGSLLIFTCEFGTNFDYMTKKCLNPSDAYCLPALSTTTTMANSSQNFENCNQKCTSLDDYTPMLNDCGRFLRCSNGVYYEFPCASGTLFDYVRRICDFPNKVTCLPSLANSMGIKTFEGVSLLKPFLFMFFLSRLIFDL